MTTNDANQTSLVSQISLLAYLACKFGGQTETIATEALGYILSLGGDAERLAGGAWRPVYGACAPPGFLPTRELTVMGTRRVQWGRDSACAGMTVILSANAAALAHLDLPRRAAYLTRRRQATRREGRDADARAERLAA